MISIKRLLDAPFILIDFWLGRLQNENTKNKPRCVCQFINHLHVLCLVTHSCPTLCDPMDCSLPGSFVHGDSLGKNAGVGSQTLLQGIFPIQGSNPGLPQFRLILDHLSHQGSYAPNDHSKNYYLQCRVPIYHTYNSGNLFCINK